MRRVLDGEIAGALYRRRQVMIEPMFADTKHNRRFTDSSDAADPQPVPSGG